MPDREKLTDAMNDVKAVENFLRKQGESWYADILSDAFDTLALLPEQEAVKPISAHVWAHTFGRCGNCEAPLPALEGLRSKFCWMCGKAVRWNA